MAEIITKAPGVSFRNVHPTKTAGRVLYGVCGDFIRCKQCGFIFDKSKHSRGSGYGNIIYVDITTIAGNTANVSNPIVTCGCPFCGASEYE